MTRPRTPKAKAAIMGRDLMNPGRFDGRNEPKVAAGIGAPPSYIKDTERSKARTAWNTFVKEIPWLNESHRSFIEIASEVRGRLIAGNDVGVPTMNLLRQCLGQMGATPADSSKVAIPDGDEDKDELLDG